MKAVIGESFGFSVNVLFEYRSAGCIRVWIDDIAPYTRVKMEIELLC